MIAAQRRNLILDLVRADGAVSVRELSERLHLSTVTIRRDLAYLDSAGLLQRTHGGALADPSTRERSYAEKSGQAMAEKSAIARFAAGFVHDGDVVVIGPGTSTELLAKNLLSRSALTIVTNSLPVADAFSDDSNNQVIMTGGTLRGSIRALVGDAPHSVLRGIHADTAFLSGNGLESQFGLSTPSMIVAESDTALARAGSSVIVLADHTKIGVRAAVQTLPPDSIHRVITDPRADPREVESLRSAGVTVDIVAEVLDF